MQARMDSGFLLPYDSLATLASGTREFPSAHDNGSVRNWQREANAFAPSVA